MKRNLTFLLVFFISLLCRSQVGNLINSLNGKTIDFKSHYDSVKVQYQVDSSFVLLENGSVLYLDSLNTSYRPIKYGQFNSVKTKIDFYQNRRDTLLVIYNFYNNRLFQIDVYTNIDSIYKSWGKELKMFFKVGFIGVIEGKQKGHISRYEVKKRTRIRSKFNFDNPNKYYSLSTTLIYEPIWKYYPSWCSTGRRKNWEAKINKKLNRH